MSTATAQKKEKVLKIKIEDNIPLPKYTKMAVKEDLGDDLEKMQPLQSRLINVDFNDKNLNAMRTRINAIIKKKGLEDRKYTVNIDPVTESKLRVWRVS